MSIQVNAGANAVNWEALLGKIGEVTKTQGAEGAAGTTNITITTNVDGVETPTTIRIPDDLEIPGEVDQTAIDSLCEKLAADTGLNLSEEQVSQFHDTLSAALNETLSASASSGSKSLKGAMFDLYKMMALLVEVAQKQRDASREMRLAENMAIQKSILNQAEAQREAAVTGMIAGAICCALQVAATSVALYQQAKAFNAQLGTDKTAGLDVARQNVDMMKAANTQENAQAQLTKVKAEIGAKMSSNGLDRISSKVENSFGNQQFNEASAKFNEAKTAYQDKVVLSQTMQAFGAQPETVTSDMVAGLDAPEVTGVKTAIAKLETYKADFNTMADKYGLSQADRTFLLENGPKDFQSLSMADKTRMMNIQQKCEGDFGGFKFKDTAQLKADVKTAFDAANADIKSQIAPNGKLRVDVEVAKENFRAQTKLEVQKFEDAYDAELKNFNEVSKNGTKAEIAAAETKLQTAADELKYARALGNAKLMGPDVTDAKAHLADVEEARVKYQSAQQTRANSIDYIKASNTINNAQATNNLIAAIGGFAQGFIQNLTQYQQAEATQMGAEQKKAEEELDQTRDLFNQAEELVNSVVQLMNAVRQAETQSMRDAIQA